MLRASERMRERSGQALRAGKTSGGFGAHRNWNDPARKVSGKVEREA